LSYTVEISPAAGRQLRRLAAATGRRLAAVIDILENNPRPAGCIRLRDSPFWRVRSGNYRVIYRINDDARFVLVVEAGHRREVYR